MALFVSPAALAMVGDSIAANLAAVALMLPLSFFAFEALVSSGVRRVILAGVLFAGLLAAYPESLPIVILVGATVVLAQVARSGFDAGRSPLGAMPSRALHLGLRMGAVLGVTFVLAPYASVRAVRYVNYLVSEGFAVATPYSLHLLNFLGFAFGSASLPALGPIGPASLGDVAVPGLTSLTGWAILVSTAALLLVAVGAVSDSQRRQVLGIPIVVALALTLWSVPGVPGGRDCAYCASKPASLATPFLLVALVLGVGYVARHPRLPRPWGAAALSFLALFLALSIGGAVREIHRTTASGRHVAPGLREVAQAASALPGSPGIFVEGVRETQSPWFDLPAVLNVFRYSFKGRMRVDSAGFNDRALIYLSPLTPGQAIRLPGPPERYAPTDYEYVLSVGSEPQSPNRSLIFRSGEFSLWKRAPTDVSIRNLAPLPDFPAEGLPNLGAPPGWPGLPLGAEAAITINSRVGAPGHVALRIGAVARPGLALRLDTIRPENARPLRASSLVCFDLPLQVGRNDSVLRVVHDGPLIRERPLYSVSALVAGIGTCSQAGGGLAVGPPATAGHTQESEQAGSGGE